MTLCHIVHMKNLNSVKKQSVREALSIPVSACL